MDPQFFWIQVCEQLKWHSKGSHTCIDTLNRLWQKHPEVKAESGEVLLDVPTLTANMIAVSLEQWTLSDLVALKHERHQKNNQPQAFPPILVLRWFDRNFLIDGGTRINFWAMHKVVGPHAVLKIARSDRDI